MAIERLATRIRFAVFRPEEGPQASAAFVGASSPERQSVLRPRLVTERSWGIQGSRIPNGGLGTAEGAKALPLRAPRADRRPRASASEPGGRIAKPIANLRLADQTANDDVVTYTDILTVTSKH